MKSWFKEMFWEDLKKETKFFIKNLKKIIKKVWIDSVDDIKRYFKSI